MGLEDDSFSFWGKFDLFSVVSTCFDLLLKFYGTVPTFWCFFSKILNFSNLPWGWISLQPVHLVRPIWEVPRRCTSTSVSIVADPVPRKSKKKMARWMVGWNDGVFSFQENWVGWMDGWLDGLGFSCFFNDFGGDSPKTNGFETFWGGGLHGFHWGFLGPGFFGGLMGPLLK